MLTVKLTDKILHGDTLRQLNISDDRIFQIIITLDTIIYTSTY